MQIYIAYPKNTGLKAITVVYSELKWISKIKNDPQKYGSCVQGQTGPLELPGAIYIG